MAFSMAIAMVVFIGDIRGVPGGGLELRRDRRGPGILLNIGEGVFRVLLFLGYLWLIGRMKEIRRVFQYHGAEHKTIAAYEHDAPLVPAEVDKFSTLHVSAARTSF